MPSPVTAAPPATGRRWPLVALVIVAGVAARLALAAAVPLTSDEAYYVDWARNLQPGYLDPVSYTHLTLPTILRV